MVHLKITTCMYEKVTSNLFPVFSSALKKKKISPSFSGVSLPCRDGLEKLTQGDSVVSRYALLVSVPSPDQMTG